MLGSYARELRYFVCVCVLPVFLKLTNVTLQNEHTSWLFSRFSWFLIYRFVYDGLFQEISVCFYFWHTSQPFCVKELYWFYWACANSIWSTLHATWQFPYISLALAVASRRGIWQLIIVHVWSSYQGGTLETDTETQTTICLSLGSVCPECWQRELSSMKATV